jgi:hypothetical protein
VHVDCYKHMFVWHTPSVFFFELFFCFLIFLPLSQFFFSFSVVGLICKHLSVLLVLVQVLQIATSRHNRNAVDQ